MPDAPALPPEQNPPGTTGQLGGPPEDAAFGRFDGEPDDFGDAGPGADRDSNRDVYEPFVPRPKYRMGRSTRVLAGVLLVAVGFLGGAAVNKAVDAGQARTVRSQFQNSGQTGSGGTGQRGSGTGTGSGFGGAGSGTGTGSGGTRTGSGGSNSGG